MMYKLSIYYSECNVKLIRCVSDKQSYKLQCSNSNFHNLKLEGNKIWVNEYNLIFIHNDIICVYDKCVNCLYFMNNNFRSYDKLLK